MKNTISIGLVVIMICLCFVGCANFTKKETLLQDLEIIRDQLVTLQKSTRGGESMVKKALCFMIGVIGVLLVMYLVFTYAENSLVNFYTAKTF